jgi:UDP-2-acetamido-2-deoxy-ribo-hexuluronate aminotransferase
MADRKIEFVNLKKQYRAYKKQIDQKVNEVMESCLFIQGPAVKSVENELASFSGSRYCVSCSSGTDALLLAMMALNIGPGDEVITTPFTFFATAETISLMKATPVFVDIEKDTYNINCSLIEKKINRNTKAIVPVGIFGQPADMDEINAIAAKYGIPVIEDAAQSYGATYKDKKSCNLSTISATSFFPAKPLGCYGDGGAVFTSNEELHQKIRILMNHGQGERYKHKYIGINGRFDSIQAAVLSVKLMHFTEELSIRNQKAANYSSNLNDLGWIKLPHVKKDRTSSFAQYSIQVPERDLFIKHLSNASIPTAIHYPIPLYRQEAYAGLACKPDEFPVTESVCAAIVSLPLCPFLEEDDQNYIIETIRKFKI